jgi:hypothetical protein
MGGEVRAREQRHADDCIRVQRDAFDKLPYTVRREARKPTQFSSEAKPWRHKDLLSAGGYRLIKHSLGYGPFRRLGNNRAIVARRYAEEVERRSAKVEHRYSSATAVVSVLEALLSLARYTYSIVSSGRFSLPEEGPPKKADERLSLGAAIDASPPMPRCRGGNTSAKTAATHHELQGMRRVCHDPFKSCCLYAARIRGS